MKEEFRFLEATVIRGVADPVRHCYWAIFYNWHTPYIVVDLPQTTKSSGEVMRQEVRIPFLPELDSIPHPSGAVLHRFREDPFVWAQTMSVQVAAFRSPKEYRDTAPVSFHLHPEEAATRHRRKLD